LPLQLQVFAMMKIIGVSYRPRDDFSFFGLLSPKRSRLKKGKYYLDFSTVLC